MSVHALERLRERLTLPREGFFLLGLSGGADSVALLLAACSADGLRIEAVHVNHGLRGTESDGDEAFARRLCREKDVKLHVFRPDLGGRKDEAAAREARYACFRQAVAETGADGILLAHHGDDQAETFLLHLFRGAGPEGLAGMSAESRLDGMLILRPMLALTREEIRQALRDEGIEWREDSSNGDSGYLRNRIRNELMPRMEAVAPGAAGRIRNAMALIRADGEALDAQAETLFSRACREERMEASLLEKAPKAVSARVLRIWWNRLSPERKERGLSREQTEALAELLDGGRRKVNLPGGWHATRIGPFLYMIPPDAPAAEAAPVTGKDTAFANWRLTETPSRGNPGDGKRAQEVPAGFTAGCVVRTRRPGDRIRPFGGCGEKKLQDYLTDRKVPQPWRDRIPLLCRDGEVLLVCGVGAGNVPAWDRNGNNVRLTWEGDIPWMESESTERT